MSFQFPERLIPPSTSPSGNTYPALLVMRETADIPAGLTMDARDRAARRITRKVLDAFWQDIEACSAAPFLQILDRGGYNERARMSRERIAEDVAGQAAQSRRLNRARFVPPPFRDAA